MMHLTTEWRKPVVFLKTNHLARNSGFTIATAAANGVLGFAFWTVADRWAPPSSIGAATALLSVIILGSIIANFGIGPTIVQRLPQLTEPSEWGSMVSAAVITSGGIAGVIGVFLLVILPHLSPLYTVILHQPFLAVSVVLGVVVLTCATMLDYVNMGSRETHIGLLRNVVFGLLKLGLLVVLVLVGVEESATSVLSVWIWSSALISLVTFAYLLPLTGHENHWPSRETWRDLGRGAVRIFWNYLAMLGGAVIPYLMPLVVITVLSPTQNAYFYMAWTIANLLLVVSAAVSGNMLAEASFASGHLRSQVILGMRIVCSLLIPATIVLVLFGRTILSAFGPGYASHSYAILLVFTLIVWPDTATNIYVTVLRVWERKGLAALLNIVMAVGSLGLAILLMPTFGALGAAWGWFLGEMIGTILAALHLLYLRSRRAPRGAAPVRAN